MGSWSFHRFSKYTFSFGFKAFVICLLLNSSVSGHQPKICTPKPNTIELFSTYCFQVIHIIALIFLIIFSLIPSLFYSPIYQEDTKMEINSSHLR